VQEQECWRQKFGSSRHILQASVEPGHARRQAKDMRSRDATTGPFAPLAGTAVAVVSRGNAPFGRLTLSGRRTTATGRSPGSRVNAVSAAFSGICTPNGEMAARLAAYSCRGSPGLEPAFPFDPLAGNLSQGRPYRLALRRARGGACRALHRSAKCHSPASARGARKGLIGKSGPRKLSVAAGTAPATVTGDAPRYHAIEAAASRRRRKARGSGKSGNRPFAVDPSRGRDVPGGRSSCSLVEESTFA
jgi:hypothetical protein